MTVQPPPHAEKQPPLLTEKQRKYLRGLAHELEAVVRLGSAGVTAGVVAETARALHDHELIKVKAGAQDRTTRDGLFQELAGRTASTLVMRIGHVAVLYRPRAGVPRILLPDPGAGVAAGP